jgi:hypothetical protein
MVIGLVVAWVVRAMAIKPDVILVFCVPVNEGNNSQDTGLMAAAAFIAKIVSTVHHLQPPSGRREIVILGLGSNNWYQS